jgi:hypothetical protein
MSVASVASFLGKARNEVNAYKDKDTGVIAQDLALSLPEARLIGELGTALTVPTAPTGAVATVISPTKVSVAFAAPSSDGGDEITGYTVNSVAGGFSATGEVSPIVVTGAFVSTTAYTFTVTAQNGEGSSAPSTASAAVTPNP